MEGKNTRSSGPGGGLYDMQRVLEGARGLAPARLVVVNPYDAATLEAVSRAAELGIVHPIMVGSLRRIRDAAQGCGTDIGEFTLVDTGTEAVLERGAALLRDGEADFIMKGMVGTGAFIHVLLDPRWGVRTENILSHAGMMEIPETGRVFLVSDAAINILPNFSRKIQIVRNAVSAARRMGVPVPRVAMLAAVETVKLPAMPATLDAFLMKKYAGTGVFGPCLVDGPFAFDNAVDPEKAGEKGIGGPVAGMADVVIAPNIETGNVIWKFYTCVQRANPAGVVLGGSCPIVVPSRADDAVTKLHSIQLARLLLG
ncbi:MAG: phosphate acyltransferase [Spirochaetota bacterium]